MSGTYIRYPATGGGGGGGSGTVTSVGLTAPASLFVSPVAGSPVTTAGSLSLSLATQTANTVFAGPSSGSAAVPAFRALVAADLPTVTANVLLGSATGGYVASGVSATTLGYLDATSSIQTQLNGKQASGSYQPAGTYVTSLSVATSNGFSGTSSGGATPAITLSTSIAGIHKGSSGAIVAATAGTDYSAGTAALATGLVKSTTSTGTLSIAVAGTDYQAAGSYLTALTGDVAASGPGSAAATIQANAVTNAKAAQMATLTLKGNNTGSTANASDLTVAQVNAILPVFTSTLNGSVPLSGGGTTNFLRADGTWNAPPAGATYKAPTIQKFLSTGTITGTLFTVTSANATVGATYTNNGTTYTVQGTIAAGTQLFVLGNATTSGATLTKASGTGDATITFSAGAGTATYTTPSSPAPLYLKIRQVGGGAGGCGGGTSSTGGLGGAGGATYFGANLLSANGGIAASGPTQPAAGGLASFGAGAIGIALQGAYGNGGNYTGLTTQELAGGAGGSTPFGGAGGAGASDTSGPGYAAVPNTGSGGGGGGASNVSGNNYSGVGGSAGGYVDVIIPSVAVSYPYLVGAAGSAGGAGTSGYGGAAGASGLILVEEHYQ